MKNRLNRPFQSCPLWMYVRVQHPFVPYTLACLHLLSWTSFLQYQTNKQTQFNVNSECINEVSLGFNRVMDLLCFFRVYKARAKCGEKANTKTLGQRLLTSNGVKEQPVGLQVSLYATWFYRLFFKRNWICIGSAISVSTSIHSRFWETMYTLEKRVCDWRRKLKMTRHKQYSQPW